MPTPKTSRGRRFFAYPRISDPGQKEGASLDAQRRKFRLFAREHGLTIVDFLEEVETASKTGRRVFGEMLRRVRRGEADGILFHKLDRSARNLRDWAEVSALLDEGKEVHLVGESIDLATRGGRFTADILAALAADFSRNLRTEVRKGMRERLEQGLYPYTAPMGYSDASGGHKRHRLAGVKRIHPKQGPLMREAFRLCATGEWPLGPLAAEMARRGLAARTGRPVSRSSLGVALRNPFYVGLMRVSGEAFEGRHEPLVDRETFEAVQAVLDGRRPRTRGGNHGRLPFPLRGMMGCASCGRTLVPQRQKGRYVYYRCHAPRCPERPLREEAAVRAIRDDLARVRLGDDAVDAFRQLVLHRRRELRLRVAQERARSDETLERIERRLEAALEARMDDKVDDETYGRYQERLLREKQELLAKANEEASEGDEVAGLVEMLKLPKMALESLESGCHEETRDCLRSVYSNLSMSGGKLHLKRRRAFDVVEKCLTVQNGAPALDDTQTMRSIPMLVNEVRKLEIPPGIRARLGSRDSQERLVSPSPEAGR